MKQSDIDWKSGRVVFWEMDSIDSERPIVEQLLELQEDLAQVKFPCNLVIDVGWYPELSEQGSFMVMVVKDENWDKPIFKERCRSVPALLRVLHSAIDAAEPQV